MTEDTPPFDKDTPSSPVDDAPVDDEASHPEKVTAPASKATPETTSATASQPKQPPSPAPAPAPAKAKAPEFTNARPTQPVLDRWQLVWDLVIFQGKLILDGGRDLLLSPLSIIVAIYALITGSHTPGRQFYDLMHLGHRTDKWINLFGSAKRVPPSDFSSAFLNSFGTEDVDEQNVDSLVSHMEELVKKQYEKGGVTANAKANIDKAFDKLNSKIHHRTDRKP